MMPPLCTALKKAKFLNISKQKDSWGAATPKNDKGKERWHWTADITDVTMHDSPMASPQNTELYF